VVELGSGTGIVGLVMGLILGAHVQLTDMEGEPLDTITQNIKYTTSNGGGTNAAGTVTPAELNWVTCKEHGRIDMPRPEPLHFVIGADLVYEDLHPEPLMWVLKDLCPLPTAAHTGDGAGEPARGPEVFIGVDERGRVGLKRFLHLASQHFEVTYIPKDEVARLTDGIGAARHVGLVRMRRCK
jgi:hypothetical protein